MQVMERRETGVHFVLGIILQRKWCQALEIYKLQRLSEGVCQRGPQQSPPQLGRLPHMGLREDPLLSD